MNKYSPFRLPVAVAAFFIALPLAAHAGVSTMSFESQDYSTIINPSTDHWATAVIANYQEQGIIINTSASNSSGKNFYVYPPSVTNRYTGSKAVEPVMVTDTNFMQITRRNGLPFDLQSFKLFPKDTGTAVQVEVKGFRVGSSTVSTTIVTSSADLTGAMITLGPNFTNLYEVRLTRVSATQYRRFQIDDIRIYEYPAISSSAAVVSESAGNALVNLSVDNPDATDITLNYEIYHVTAQVFSDFNYPNGTYTGQITIPASTGRADLAIPIVNDSVAEPLEEIYVVFNGNPSGTRLLNGGGVSVKIGDDDSTDFAQWMSAHGLTGNNALPNADPNGDGISNIETWLHRINPAGPSPAAWLNRRATYVTATGNVPALRFTVPRPLPADVRMIFEESTSLNIWSEQTRRSGYGLGSSWTGSGASRVSEASNVNENIITLPASQSVSSRPNAFLRMKYELSSGGGSRD